MTARHRLGSRRVRQTSGHRSRPVLAPPESLEPRLALTSPYLPYDLDVYSMLIINKMRADPAAFGRELKNLNNNTAYVSTHGMKGDDPIWTDLRAIIKSSEGRQTAAGIRWYSGFDGRSGTTFLSVISGLPQTGPLVMADSDERAADHHTDWMMANGYAHTGQLPTSRVDGLGYNPSATPDTWDGTDMSWEGPFQGKAENISYWHSVSDCPATERAWRSGTLTWNGYFQRLIYADLLGFMLEMNNGSATHPWGHLLNLASYSPDHPDAGKAASAGNKQLGVLNGLGISYRGGPTSTEVTTHRLSYDPNENYVAILTYQDLNNNRFYDVGEGLDMSGRMQPYSLKPGGLNLLGYDWGGRTTGATATGPGLYSFSVEAGTRLELDQMGVLINGVSHKIPDRQFSYGKRNQVIEYRFTGTGSLGLGDNTKMEAVTSSQKIDLDGDGLSDTIWRKSSGATVAWIQESDGSIRERRTLRTNAAWTVTAMGDFNADGVTDLVWRSTAGLTEQWIMQPTGGAGSMKILGADKDWSVAVSGDYNGDGKQDLVWRNAATGSSVMWLMNGAEVTSTAPVGGNADWRIVAATAGLDANGDGMTDLVWRDAKGNCSLWLMSGSVRTSMRGIGGDAAWSLVGAGDFDGNGSGDLLWRNSSGAVVMRLMDGGADLLSASIGTASDGTVAATMDADNNGRSDIVWRKANGATVVKLMAGTKTLTIRPLASSSELSIVRGPRSS